MSIPGRAGGPFAKFAYKPGVKSGGGTSSEALVGGKKKSRRIVEDDEEDEEVLTSTDFTRTIPRKKTAVLAAASTTVDLRESPAGKTGGDGAASDEGTSSGEEDNAWFKKPSTASAVTVKRATAMAKPGGNPGWLTKNDPAKLTASQRQNNVNLAKAQRSKNRGKAKKVGKKGVGRRPSADADDDSEKDYKGSSRAKSRSGAARASLGAGRDRGRRQRGDVDDDSEPSVSTADSEEEDEEGEFESGDDDSDGEDDESEPELTDASEGENDPQPRTARAEGLTDTPAAARKKRPTTSAVDIESPRKKAKGSGAGLQSRPSAAMQGVGGGGSKKLAAVNGLSRKIESSKDEGSSGDGREKKLQNNGAASERGSVTRGPPTRILKGVVADMDEQTASSSSSNSSNRKRENINDKSKQRIGSGVRMGGGQGDAADDDVAIVGVSREGHAKEASAAGDAKGASNRAKAKRRFVAVAGSESNVEEAEEEQEVIEVGARQAAPPEKKKQKVKHSRDDDDMDASDRGSDSDNDGARARRVLEECSALSKKLASVISSWAASGDGEEEGGTEEDGALGLTQMRQGGGEGKAVTTKEEIQEACPGLKLNPYQLVGVNWMCLLRETGVNGVLADEMGLGKTVQTIAFFALLRHRRQGAPPRRPHIIVVPSSVLDNWDSELKKFCPALKLVKYHGSQKDRSAIRQRLNRVSSGADREGMPDIVLTTYVMWERESCGDDRSFLKRFKYDYMVLDEGHSIKNIKSSRFQRLRMVVSKHRLLLSGTPVQNNLGELLALLSFLMPNIFRSDVIETLLEFLGDGDSLPPARLAASSSSNSSPFQVREVRGMLAPFVLRRLKAGVLKQLVAKTEQLEMVALSKVQRSVYDGVLEEHVRQKRAAIDRALAAENAHIEIVHDGIGDSKSNAKGSIKATRSKIANTKKGGGGADAETALDVDEEEGGGALEAAGISAKEIKNVFTELRKGANHPLMLLNYFKGGGKLEEVIKVLHRTGYFGAQATKDMVVKEVQTYSDFDLHQVCSSFDSLRHLCLPEEALWTSAKMERLRTLLPELVSKGHRVLLFSQWTRLLDLLEVLLQDSMGLTFCRLDGSTPVSERKALIDRFGSDRSIPVFLLSTRAGGLGINLTSADTVILHDVDFNPENDRQAEDRCHRIGQTKPVTVIKMVAQGTVDEDIYTTGERKKKVNKSVLNDAASKEPDATATISGILKKAIQAHLSSSSSR